jgi:transposase
MVTQEKNRLSGSHLEDLIREQIKKTIEFHQGQIGTLDEYLEKAILEDPEMKARYDLLMKVKGIGPVSAVTLLTSMPELGTMNKKQAAALLGVAPINNDSGKSKGYRKCMGGRANVRSALFSATMAAIRFNPAINEFAKRLIPTKGNNGKISKVIMVACMRKMIGMLNAILRDKTDWNAEYYKKFA